MYCGNCGIPLKDDETICPNCQTPVNEVTSSDSASTPNLKYEEYKETEKLSEKYDFNKLLIYSILELVCCSRLFGIIALILIVTQLKSAIDQRKFEDADKAQNQVKTILIIGLVFGVVINIIYVALQFLPILWYSLI